MKHVAFSSSKGSERVVVFAPDTDVVTLCVYFVERIEGLKELWVWKSMSEFIPAHEISASLGPCTVSALLAVHARTGFDTISRLYRKRKRTAMHALQQNPTICEGFPYKKDRGAAPVPHQCCPGAAPKIGVANRCS